MTRHEQRQEALDREGVLRAQRSELETDLMHVATLIETDSATWIERRAAVQVLEEKLDDGRDGEQEEARMEWYVAAFEDAQHALVVTHGLMQRYNEIAQALTSCQQELMQLTRDHRRG